MARRPRTSIIKDSFRKRSQTVIRKAHELAVRHGAQVYVVVQFNGRFQTYNSVEGEQWPPTLERIVSADDHITSVYRILTCLSDSELSVTRTPYVFEL